MAPLSHKKDRGAVGEDQCLSLFFELIYNERTLDNMNKSLKNYS